jgi:hypothetical protein
MDRARAEEIAQAWIDASPDEQAALNRFAALEEALVALVPASEEAWTVAELPGRGATVLLLAGRALLAFSIAGGERSGAPPAEVRCRYARVEQATLAIELAERADGAGPRFTFAGHGPPPLELSGSASSERFARALAAAAGWSPPGRSTRPR